MIPTKRFWLIFALGIPVAAFAFFVGQPLLIFAYDGLLVAVAIFKPKMRLPARKARIALP